MLILPSEPYLPGDEPWLRHQHVLRRHRARARAAESWWLSALLALAAIAGLLLMGGAR